MIRNWTILLILLLMTSCKTIYVYPTYDYPELPEFSVSVEDIEIVKNSLSGEEKKAFARFLGEVKKYKDDWTKWAKRVIELTTHHED